MSHVSQSQQQPATSAVPPIPLPNFSKMSPVELTAWLESPAAPREAEGHPNPQIRRLCELNEEHKAGRLSMCGKFLMRECPNAHTYSGGTLHCGLQTCTHCAPRLVLDTYHRWQATVEAYETDHPHAQFTLLDISKPLPRDRALAIVELGRIGLITSAGPTWSYLVGYDGNILRLRVLVVTQQRSQAYWESIWPGARIKASVYPIYELRNVFLGQLLKVELPRSPIDRAEQEVLLARIHRFRARGIKILRAGGDISAIGGNTIAERSVGFLLRKCPHCGLQAVRRSQWFPAGHPKPTPEQIRWRADRL